MIRKRRGWFTALAAMAVAVLIGGCASGPGQDQAKGSRSNPYMAGEAVSYEGYGRQGDKYTLEYKLVDTVRGSMVNEMLYRASGLDIEESGLLESGKELLVIRMDIRAVESKGDRAISFHEEKSPRFRLVSTDGIVYEDSLYAYFDGMNQMGAYYEEMSGESGGEGSPARAGNPVGREPDDMYPGASQSFYLFYLVDGADKRPVLGVGSEAEGDVWFCANLFERERGDDRIGKEVWRSGDIWEEYPWWSEFGIDPSDTYEEDYDDWLQKQQEYGYDYEFKVPIDEEGGYGGAPDQPLPVGETGLYVERSASDAWAMECRVEEFLRGEEALQYRQEHDSGNGTFYLSGDRDLVMVRVRINYLESNSGDTFSIDSDNFTLCDREAKDEPFERLGLGQGSVYGELYAPGTCETVLYYEVPKGDFQPLLTFGNGYYGEEDYLTFDLSPGAALPKGVGSYESVYQPSLVSRDSAKPSGSRQNPVEIKIEHDFSGDEDSYYYDGKLSVLESCRGEAAKDHIDLSKAPALGAGEEYFAVKVNADYQKSAYSELDYDWFQVIGRDNMASGTGLIDESAMKKEESDGSKDQETVWVGFKVREAEEDLLIGYGFYNAVWFEVQDEADRVYPTV